MSRVDFDFRVPADHPSLPGHFPGQPIVPGVLLLDHVLVALQQATVRRVVRLQQVKFTSALRPDELAFAVCEIEGRRALFRVAVQRGRASVMLASGNLSLHADDGAPA